MNAYDHPAVVNWPYTLDISYFEEVINYKTMFFLKGVLVVVGVLK